MSTEDRTPLGASTKPGRRLIRKIVPIYEQVLIRHDKDQDKTLGGIILSDSCKIPTLTGVIAAMPDAMKENPHDYPFSEGDQVIYDVRDRVPYTFDPRDNYYLVDRHRILARIEETLEDD